MKKNLAVAFLIFSMVFISCDQDFNTIGADLVGDEHFDFDTHEVNLKAYSLKTGEVQTNNLPINPLGFYNNPFFGETKANFVTQVALTTAQPKFGTNVQIENVTLYVPYFCSVDATNSDGSKEYTLDSIYSKDEASKVSKMKLSVYENGFALKSFGGATGDDDQTASRYYSNMDGAIDAQKRGHNNVDGTSIPNGVRLNDSSDPAENDQFFFNKEEIIVYKRKLNTVTGELEYVDANGAVLQGADQTDPTKWVVKERLSPGIYLTLNRDFFEKKIFGASASDLFNNNKFREYFKGLYFKMEQVAGQEGAMAMINFNNAKLNVNYTSVNDGAPAGTAATSKAFVINVGSGVGGNTVSLQDFAYTDTSFGNYNTGLSSPANTFGSPTFGQNERLYVKGGKGSVVYIDVFGDTDVLKIVNGQLVSGTNGVSDELDELRLKGWLINDAYLEFYVDKSAMSNNSKYQEAERLYLFDATNQKPIIDYSYDTSISSNAKRNKLVYGGIIKRDDTDEKGVKYKIRVTQHINNLINSDNEKLNKNVKLGLSVTENIALTGNYYYKDKLTFDASRTDDDIEYFPVSSIIAQQGTVLHGTHSTETFLDSDGVLKSKKLKLTIHFTKPN
ncbi:DUF4270 domain-containing protein [Flavobacterium terrigena]|uniref:DUF4270 domain-containing protein n=1 Tax=Flavobacterium terrigena TaxID=402734 RepID=A0A1H6SNI5_9FLAO|nr:DUF4270 domain-containing protein [Flavobacterium terrigena]SEI69383.1 protein of unknown function [Flavobacterium terrigena]